MRIAHYLLALALILAVSMTTAGCGGTEKTPDGDQEFADRMAEEHEGDEPVAGAGAGEPAKPVVADRVAYGKLGDRELTGYLARPQEVDPKGLPAILVIHEWWGLNEHIESMTRQLAGQGYVALAVDLYAGEVAASPDQARELMTAANEKPAAANKNLRRAHSFLQRRYETDKTAVIGWCFGGGWSLQTAILLPGELDAAVIYYGRLIPNRKVLAKIETPILGIFGSEDQGIPVAGVRRFETALQELGKEASIHVYEGADHAFANPTGNRYDAEAAADAWQKTLAFFKEHLGS